MANLHLFRFYYFSASLSDETHFPKSEITKLTDGDDALHAEQIKLEFRVNSAAAIKQQKFSEIDIFLLNNYV